MNQTLRQTVFALFLAASTAASTGCGMLTARPLTDTSEVLTPTRREESILKDYHLTANTRRGQAKIREIRHTDLAIQKARDHMEELRQKGRKKFETPINEIYGVPNPRPATRKPTIGIEVH